MSVCPTCGQPVNSQGESDRLLAVLRNSPERHVYRGADGSGWYVTYGGGRFSWPAVELLVQSGAVQPCYSDCPGEAYHIGKTLDVKATLEERRKHRSTKDAPLIYTDGSQGRIPK